MACDQCKVEAEVDGRRVFVTIRRENVETLRTDPARWATLYRCRVCGTYWELGADQRSFTELSAGEARRRYPTLFAP